MTCRYREKEAVPYVPNSQSIYMCLRSERFKSKAEVLLLLVQVKDPNLALRELGEHAGNLYLLLPISKLLELFHVGWRAKHPEVKAPTGIPGGTVHAW